MIGTPIPLTPEIKGYLLANFETESLTDMAKHLNVSKSKVSNWLSDLKVRKRRVDKRYAGYIPCFERDGFFEHDKNLMTI